MEPCLLTELQLDALREISNIGMGHAATALSQLLDTQINMEIPSVHRLNLASIHNFVGGAEQPVAGIMLQMSGDASGLMMLIFPRDCALHLIGQLTGKDTTTHHQLDELDISAIKEIGNILASAYLNAIGTLLNLTLLPSDPSLSIDMAGAVLDPILSRQCGRGDISLLVQAKFNSVANDMTGQFFLMPDPDSLRVLLLASGTANA